MVKMMTRALIISPPSLGSFLEVNEGLGHGGSRSSPAKRRLIAPLTVASASEASPASRSHGSIPKLKPFSRNLLEKALKEPPLIQKTVNELSDYCTTLDGDECYSCWRAYFELKELEQVAPKLDLERTILESNGLSSLIRSIHRSVAIYNLKKEGSSDVAKAAMGEQGEGSKRVQVQVQEHRPVGLPKTLEELEEEEKARMVDSPHTRLLRAMSKYPAWFTPAPDHVTY